MTNDCIAQTWYRFMRTIGSPCALCSPQIISKTPQFMQWVVSRADGVEPFHHPCLLQLPFIFLKAIKGISSQVDAFLGMEYEHFSHNHTISDCYYKINLPELLLFLSCFSQSIKWHLMKHLPPNTHTQQNKLHIGCTNDGNRHIPGTSAN